MAEALRVVDMHVVDCHDLSLYATRILGRPYDALAARSLAYDAVNQDTYQTVDTARAPWLDDSSPTVEQFLAFDRSVADTMEFRYDFERQNWLRDNTPTPDPETVLRYLAENDHIQHGKYLIQYWW